MKNWQRLNSEINGEESVGADLGVVAGFRSAGATGGIKKSGKPDVSLIVADEPAVCAAAFTKNRAAAASVAYCRDVLKKDFQRIIVANSGNANCCTGDHGMRDTIAMAQLAAESIGCAADEVFVCSTGVIGVPLPLDAVSRGIKLAAAQLDKPEVSAACGILTTDLVTKTCAYRHKAGYHVAGICKGSGMIHPNMATMLAFVLTDVKINKQRLQEITSRAVKRSFNRISVDNDESTNDTCIVMSSGKHVLASDAEHDEFELLLTHAMQDLAKQIVRDGEGAQSFVEVTVKGCVDEDSADKIAGAICDSMLVKTAIAGKDPNWGRIVAAAGYAGIDADFNTVRVYLNEVLIYSEGTGHSDLRKPFSRAGVNILKAELAATMQAGEQNIVLDFGPQGVSATRWTCDLTHGYISINADYTT